jgi:Uncharacterized conserved protein
MNRTITVRGVGTAKTKPDQIIVSIDLNAKDMDYEKAIFLADDKIERLTSALCAVGYEKDALKTVNFNVNTSYQGYHDDKGMYRQVFDGYIVNHSLKLAFDFSNERLGETLTAIASCDTQPQLNISFTVKDPAGIKEALLKSAAENAKSKAELLTAASGVRLGQLINIDYNWGEVNTFSRTRFNAMDEAEEAKPMMRAFGASANFTPEDISSSDSAAFTWEIMD